MFKYLKDTYYGVNSKFFWSLRFSFFPTFVYAQTISLSIIFKDFFYFLLKMCQNTESDFVKKCAYIFFECMQQTCETTAHYRIINFLFHSFIYKYQMFSQNGQEKNIVRIINNHWRKIYTLYFICSIQREVDDEDSASSTEVTPSEFHRNIRTYKR